MKKSLFFIFAEFIKNESATLGNGKCFILDCLKFNFGFFDSYAESGWNNKLIIDVPTINRMSVEDLARHIEMNVNKYRIQRMESLIKNTSVWLSLSVLPCLNYFQTRILKTF